MSEQNNEQLAEDVVVEVAEVAAEPTPEIVKEETFVEEIAAELEIEASVTEVEQPKPADNVITAPSFPSSDVPALGVVGNGVIGSTVTKPEPKKAAGKKAEKKKDTVAIFSTKNVTWPGVGKVYRGYNIVEKAEADQWLTRSHARLATPEEVAREFGK